MLESENFPGPEQISTTCCQKIYKNLLCYDAFAVDPKTFQIPAVSTERLLVPGATQAFGTREHWCGSHWARFQDRPNKSPSKTKTQNNQDFRLHMIKLCSVIFSKAQTVR